MNRTHVRTALVGLLLVWMTAGPVYRQVFNGTNKLFPAWHMYRGFGLGLLDVELTRVDGGTEVPVDRLAALGFADWREAPMVVRRIKSVEQLERQVATVCEALGPGVDLRVNARVAKIDGWRTVRDGRVNACR